MGSQAVTQPTEPHQPGQDVDFSVLDVYHRYEPFPMCTANILSQLAVHFLIYVAFLDIYVLYFYVVSINLFLYRFFLLLFVLKVLLHSDQILLIFPSL